MNPTFVSNTCPIDASSMPFYPPRVTPPAKPLNLPQSFIEFLRNPLLIIPEPVYHEPLVVLRGPAAIVWVTDPTLVKIVLADRCNDFPQDPLLRPKPGMNSPPPHRRASTTSLRRHCAD
jgi:hypothetical protein